MRSRNIPIPAQSSISLTGGVTMDMGSRLVLSLLPHLCRLYRMPLGFPCLSQNLLTWRKKSLW